MQMTVENIEAQMHCLSAADRSRLLDNVVRSLGVDASVSAAWLKVAVQRSDDLRSGQVKGIPLEQVLAELEVD